jgi:hypothetical protein
LSTVVFHTSRYRVVMFLLCLACWRVAVWCGFTLRRLFVQGTAPFLGGLLAFLIGHALYAAAFIVRGVSFLHG